MALKDSVRIECKTELVTEESPVGDHQAGGSVERAIKSVQGQVRTMKGSVEGRYDKVIILQTLVQFLLVLSCMLHILGFAITSIGTIEIQSD